MRVLTLKMQTAANIKIPGYPAYTIKFINGVSGVYGKNGYIKRELCEYIIYNYIYYTLDILTVIFSYTRAVRYQAISIRRYLTGDI